MSLFRLDAYAASRQLLAEVGQLRWPRGWADLADQTKRAAASVMLNLAEGWAQPRGSGAKRRHYEIALGSAAEVAAALDASAILGVAGAEAAHRRALRVAALLGGLCRSQRR